jgi:hypothetical protein
MIAGRDSSTIGATKAASRDKEEIFHDLESLLRSAMLKSAALQALRAAFRQGDARLPQVRELWRNCACATESLAAIP